jgi:hypothetical protein
MSDFPILDSLGLLSFPDDNRSYEGNDIFKRIVAKSDSIQMCVIEKIKDTTATDYKVADAYVYTVSDMAILLLPYITKERINVWDLLYEKFEIVRRHRGFLFQQTYHSVFFGEDASINYKNRIRFYEAVKKKYRRASSR